MVQVGCVVNEFGLSPFTNPEYDGETAGTVPPYTMPPDDAEITSAVGTTVTVP